MSPQARRRLHRVLFTGLVLATLLALFYAEEDWRGARAEAAVERDLAARDEPVTLPSIVPPAIPADQNLAMAPIFLEALRYRIDPHTGLLSFGPREDPASNPLRATLDNLLYGPNTHKGVSSPRPTGNWESGHRRNLAIWQAYYRQRLDFPHAPEAQTPAQDILLAQSRYAEVFAALTSAAERPLARFPVNWTQLSPGGMNFFHCNLLHQIIATLSLRASAHLDASQSADARQDLALSWRLLDTLTDEPLLISGLTETTLLNSTVQPLWEGLEARTWTAEDLVFLQDKLARFNFLRIGQQALRGERTVFLDGVFRQMRDPAGLKILLGDYQRSDQPMELAIRLLPYTPRGWIGMNRAWLDRDMQNYIDVIDPVRGHVWKNRLEAADQASTKPPAWPPLLPARSSAGPLYDGLLLKFTRAQVIVDQAVTACALERYYLDHQAYPDVLAALVPTYLDRVRIDPMDGAPLRYRLTADGRYLLYSIGWDEKDEGGAIGWSPDRAGRYPADTPREKLPYYFLNVYPSLGDWVWQYAPATPPDPPANTSRLPSR